MSDAMEQYSGNYYEYGHSARTLGFTAGSSDDYDLGSVGVTNAYTFEVRPFEDTGFMPPPSAIVPICMEVYVGFRALMDGIIKEMDQF